MLKRRYWWRKNCEHLPPWYYGYVGYDPLRNQQLFAVLPFNWLIRAGRYLCYQWDRLRGLPPRYELIQREVVYDLTSEWGDRRYVMFPYELRIGAHVMQTLIPAIHSIGYKRHFTEEANRQLKAVGIPFRYKFDSGRFSIRVTNAYGEDVQMEEITLLVALNDQHPEQTTPQ